MGLATPGSPRSSPTRDPASLLLSLMNMHNSAYFGAGLDQNPKIRHFVSYPAGRADLSQSARKRNRVTPPALAGLGPLPARHVQIPRSSQASPWAIHDA